jgi:hypothetical protein
MRVKLGLRRRFSFIVMAAAKWWVAGLSPAMTHGVIARTDA